ncbi:MAG: TRAP transporter substrate-binding protein DctP [Rhodospirillaceae bacterium]|nr:TRAP transporter substrate-binding protein DctP [Rhodospirillaceae bacterium]
MVALRPVWPVFSLLLAWCLAMIAQAHGADPRAVSVWIPGHENSLSSRQMVYLTKRIEERLPRHFTFTVQTGAACPNEPELLSQVRAGRVDVVVLGDAVVDEVPRLSLFRLPWLFNGREHVQGALYAGLEDEVRSHVEDSLKVVVIGLYESGFHHIRADRAILGPEDLVQRKILVNEGRKMRDVLRSLGAVPQKYPPERAAEAIEQGIVDSFDGPIDALGRLPIGEKAPVITLTRHVYEPSFVITSQAFWESLSDAERAAITEIGVGFSDTASKLAVTYYDAARKRLPRYLRLQPLNPERFTAITKQRRAAYEQAFGPDWLELVDIGQEAAEAAQSAR